MNRINSLSFYGHGSESTGSIAHRNNPTQEPKQCPTCGNHINFWGYDSYEKEGSSTLGTIATVALLTAGVIGGLGYAHKAKAFEKLGEGWMKKTVGKLEPAGKKCHEWCSLAKTKGSELWTKISGFFSKKS